MPAVATYAEEVRAGRRTDEQAVEAQWRAAAFGGGVWEAFVRGYSGAGVECGFAEEGYANQRVRLRLTESRVMR